nr:phage portal protein [Clostridia bacterium]
MYTTHTYQDWKMTPDHKRPEMLLDIIKHYKSSDEFHHSLVAMKYYNAENEAVGRKMQLKPQQFTVKKKVVTPSGNEVTEQKTEVRNVQIEGNRVYSRFFFRIITQENQHLLGNGVKIREEKENGGATVKDRLGIGFDSAMQRIGEKALVCGVCWGYWNSDHIEVIDAVKDPSSGFVALVDEETSAPCLGVQFWQLSIDRPMYVRLFELDGLTVYRTDKDGQLVIYKPKRAYRQKIARDALGVQIIGESNYSALPLVPLYANPEHRSEFTNDIRSKIDAYDRIASDFVDNLDQANDIYWVLNNFGGNTAEIAQMLEQINKLRAVVNISDGTGSGSTAEPHTFEVPHEARNVALQILEKQIYEDAMALNIKEISGGSLTNVAIKASMTNLNLKCDRYEWQAFAFVQGVLRLIGVETESISFVRQTLVNQSEVVTDIAAMREDIDQETALRLNPYIMEEDIEGILQRSAEERYTGMARYPPEEVMDDGQDDASGGEDRAEDA